MDIVLRDSSQDTEFLDILKGISPPGNKEDIERVDILEGRDVQEGKQGRGFEDIPGDTGHLGNS